jgi:hypothetical protein
MGGVKASFLSGLGLTLFSRGRGAESVRASVAAVSTAIARNSGVKMRFCGGLDANGCDSDINGDSGFCCARRIAAANHEEDDEA